MLPPLILQISLIIACAFVGGFVAHKLRLSVIIGYIFVGFILGAVFSNNLEGQEFLSFFSEIGIALLLFTLGLEFNFDHIRSVGRPAALGAFFQIVIVTTAGFVTLPAIMSISYTQALFISFAVSLSSTVVVSKILYGKGDLTASYGELSLGWLVTQDLMVLPILVILSLAGGGIHGNGVFQVAGEIFTPIIKALFVLYITLILGRKLIPYLFKKLALVESSELLLLASFSFAILFAYFANFLGVTFAVGAFLAGLALSSAVINHEVFAQIRPLRDLFSSIFFVSIGLLAVRNFPISNIPLVLVLFAVVVVLKILSVFFISLKFGFHTKVSFLTATALFGVGEFSLVIGKLGSDTGILDQSLFNVLVATTALTLIATPFLSRVSKPLYKKIFGAIKIRFPRAYGKFFYKNDHGKSFPLEKEEDMANHIIIVGYGRVGRESARIFDFAKVPYVVIDYSLKHLKELKGKGRPIVYGDAVNEEILTVAGVKTCKAIVIAIPDARDSELILNHCLRLNPTAKFIARAHRDCDAARLKVRGVSSVVEPEFEASLSLVRHALYSMEMGIEEIETLLAKARRGYRF